MTRLIGGESLTALRPLPRQYGTGVSPGADTRRDYRGFDRGGAGQVAAQGPTVRPCSSRALQPAPVRPGPSHKGNLLLLHSSRGLQRLLPSPDLNQSGNPLLPDTRQFKGYRAPRPLAALLLPIKRGSSAIEGTKVYRVREPRVLRPEPVELPPAAEAKAAPRVAEVPAPRPEENVASESCISRTSIR